MILSEIYILRISFLGHGNCVPKGFGNFLSKSRNIKICTVYQRFGTQKLCLPRGLGKFSSKRRNIEICTVYQRFGTWKLCALKRFGSF